MRLGGLQKKKILPSFGNISGGFSTKFILLKGLECTLWVSYRCHIIDKVNILRLVLFRWMERVVKRVLR